jgi:hypothetical protein
MMKFITLPLVVLLAFAGLGLTAPGDRGGYNKIVEVTDDGRGGYNSEFVHPI